MELWRVTQPDRVFCLVSEDSTLVIQAVEAARVSISLASAAETERLLASSSKAKQICRVQGCLGLLNHGSDIFLCVVESAITVGSLQRQDSVFRVASVSFHCLNTGRFDLDALLPSTGGHGLQPNPGNEQQQTYIEHPCASISRILTNGNFYFSSVVDLSSSLEARLRRGNDRASSYNPQFLWNHYLLSSLLSFRSNLTSTEQDAFDRAGFLLMAIQGYIGNVDIQVSGSDTLSLSVISRLSWHRAGTRFNSRGIDDEGAVANFVETETVVRTATSAMSYIQLRGSVPLFWEQQATQPWATKVQLTRPAIASQPAFNKHFDDLLKHYPRVHICNLLGTRDHESQLTRVYEAHLRTLTSEDPDFATRLQLTNFDFHARARKGGGIESIEEQLSRERSLMAATDRFSFCMASQSKKGYELVSSQEGVFRTNCLDCLDRTNVIQTCLSQNAVRTFVSSINPEWFRSESLWAMHRNLFAENGDALARIYAGTGALNTSFTRQGKRTLAGVLSDAGKSVGRVIQSNFADAGKQAAIDELLGNMSNQQRVQLHDPIHSQLDMELKARHTEYSSFKSGSVFCGTYNLNGRPPGTESLLPWLFPDPSVEPDILVIGFQEIVQLTPGQIVATDPEKKRRWEAHLLKVIGQRRDAKGEYVLLRSEQLVGTALIIMVKTSVVNSLRNVEASTKKTGLKGMAGNKGGIAIRLDWADSSFCFVTAHFAAGSSNLEERNENFAVISEHLVFKRGRFIPDHENIVWLGDFNYRISMPNDMARQCAKEQDIDTLFRHDQLNLSMESSAVFAGYTEAPIVFQPTYKYDTGTDDFDSSEKQRVPSWTDRILTRGSDLDVARYTSADIRLSDHRPVMAIIRCRYKIVDKVKRDKFASEILDRLHKEMSPGLIVQSRTSSPISINLENGDSEPWWATANDPDGLIKDPALWATEGKNLNPFESSEVHLLSRKPPPRPMKLVDR